METPPSGGPKQGTIIDTYGGPYLAIVTGNY
jgi:hypothetical protein